MTFHTIPANESNNTCSDHLAPARGRLRRRLTRGIYITLASTSVFCLSTTLLAAPAAKTAGKLCLPSHGSDFAKVLNFRMASTNKTPGGWLGGPTGTVFLAPKVVHNGQKVVLLERHSNNPAKFSTLTSCIQMDFSGKTITLQGFVRTKNVSGFAGLWMREDGYEGVLAFDNMWDKHLHGTIGWEKYSVTLPHMPQARRLVFGVQLTGAGRIWVSSLQLLADDKPVWKAPKVKLPQTVLDTDRQFDHGAGIVIKKLTPVQIANLVTLGKVWGFLKYYDPVITSGKRQWDYALFRILPTILGAQNQEAANAALVQWIKKLGPVPHCNPCANLDTKNLHLRPDLGWINDKRHLGKDLSDQLRQIRDNRRIGKQFYVAQVPTVGNPVFEHELPYSTIKFPDAGFQLLALYRFWNIIEYWYPYRNMTGEDWDKVLAEFIPKLALAKNKKDYQLQLMALIAKVHDTHANLVSSLNLRPPVGNCHLPVRLRFVGNQVVVTGYMDGKQPSSSPLQRGDAIIELDNKRVSALIKEWSPYYGASNRAALLREIAIYMTRGTCGDTTVGVRRNGRVMRINAKRVLLASGDLEPGTHDLPGAAFRLLSPQVAYLKLSSIEAGQLANYIKRAADTKGLIIDLRNYPSEYVVYALGSLLINQVTYFARATAGDLENPGAFYWTLSEPLTPRKPQYTGKIVILVDDITLSQAEYTSMALRSAPGAIVVGSATSGADGDISPIPLPGGLRTLISGIGIFYPDKRPTQRVGIIPNVVVKPTIADVREGRDPVLEIAMRLILGSKISNAKLRKMYQAQTSDSFGN